MLSPPSVIITGESSSSSTQNNKVKQNSAVQTKSISTNAVTSQLHTQLENALHELPISESTSLYIAPKNETPIILHNKQVQSASMIKVFILEYLFYTIEQNQNSLTTTLTLHSDDKVGGGSVLAGYPDNSELTLDELANLMITQSDNTATNMLIDYLGMESINQYITNQEYTDTKLQRKMMDFTELEQSQRNLTSANDLGTWFTSLANGTMLHES